MNELLASILTRLNNLYGRGKITKIDYQAKKVHIRLQFGTEIRKFRVLNGFVHFRSHRQKLSVKQLVLDLCPIAFRMNKEICLPKEQDTYDVIGKGVTQEQSWQDALQYLREVPQKYW